ncbi:MAG: putative toxin-antitoxin system toxin component, PIN family [Hadesarchaea archaeon]|nr:putative toxin-antitoxin system toxin component, PIN family [Hadesarchaea archaeon]
MLRIVVDTNVFISSLIRGGKPRQLIFKIDGVNVKLVSSEPLLKELVSILAKDKIRRYVSRRDVEEFLKYLGKRMVLVEIKSGFKVVKDDPKDDVVLNTAYSAKADYIVSGDKHLTSLRRFKSIKVVTANEMLKILGRGN